MNATAAVGGDSRIDPGLQRLVDVRARGVEIAEQFEQVFVQQMVEKMRQTVDVTGDGEGLFAKGPGSDTYAMWFDRLLGERVQAESHLGIADAIVTQLEKHREVPRLEELRQRLQEAGGPLPHPEHGRLDDVLA